MIKILRRKFIAITMVSVTLVLFGLITAINIFNYNDVMSSSDAKLSLLSMYDGSFGVSTLSDSSDATTSDSTTSDAADSSDKSGDSDSSDKSSDSKKDTEPPELLDEYKNNPDLTEETPFNTRYFTITIDEDGNITAVNVDHIAAVSSSEASEMAISAYNKNKTHGFSGNYKFTTTSVTDEDGNTCTMYIFLDCTSDLSNFKSFLYASIGVSFLGVALVFILVLFLSKLAVKPMAESYEKQKRFITDASHEIKTPLAIIDANTEVIELENGESEWTESIKRQIKRLSSLTEKLVFLSRMDEEGSHLNVTDFSISNAVDETVQSFLGVAESKGKVLISNVDENLYYKGDESMIRQMTSLLVDNALKYSNEGGRIEVSLSESGKNKILKVSNTVDRIQQGNLNMLFERFYRNDSSRNSKTGGHGIGLSVVQAIVNAHKGKVSAESKDGISITFTAIL